MHQGLTRNSSLVRIIAAPRRGLLWRPLAGPYLPGRTLPSPGAVSGPGPWATAAPQPCELQDGALRPAVCEIEIERARGLSLNHRAAPLLLGCADRALADSAETP